MFIDKDAEAGKKVLQLKQSEYRTNIERLKGEIKAIKTFNKKLQLRVQTFEKKIELQQIKEQRITTLLEKSNEELEQTKIERDTYLALVQIKQKSHVILLFNCCIFFCSG